MPDWKPTMHLMNETISLLLPHMNDSIHFLERMSSDMQTYLDHAVLDGLVDKVAQLKAWNKKTVLDFDAFTESFASTADVEQIRHQIDKVGAKFKCLDILSSSEELVFSGRALLVFTPSMHGLFALFLIGVGGVVGLYEVKKLHRVGSKTLLNTGKSLGAKIIRLGTFVALSLLWLDLLIAGMCYIIAMLAVSSCLPVLDMTIFTQYIDDPKVWAGKTWIESKLERFTDDKNFTRGVKMLEVLKSCSEDHSVFYAITNGREWNLESKFHTDELKIEELHLISAVHDAIDRVQLPNYLTISKDVKFDLDKIQTNMDFNFTQMIEAEVSKFKSMKLIKQHLMPLVRDLLRDPKFNYIQERLHQVITDLERIEQYSMPQAVESLRQLLPLKDVLFETKEALDNITLSLIDVFPLMNNSFHPKVCIYVNLVTTITNNFIKNFMQQAVRKVTEQIGNCRILYNLYMRARWGLCDYGVTLMNAVWILHGLMGIAMAIMMLLSIRIAAYFRGAHRTHATWKSRLHIKELEMKNSVTSAEGIMVSANGEMLGPAVVVRGHRNRFAIHEQPNK